MQFREQDIKDLINLCHTTDRCSITLLKKLEDYLEEYSCDENLARTYPPYNLY